MTSQPPTTQDRQAGRPKPKGRPPNPKKLKGRPPISQTGNGKAEISTQPPDRKWKEDQRRPFAKPETKARPGKAICQNGGAPWQTSILSGRHLSTDTKNFANTNKLHKNVFAQQTNPPPFKTSHHPQKLPYLCYTFYLLTYLTIKKKLAQFPKHLSTKLFINHFAHINTYFCTQQIQPCKKPSHSPIPHPPFQISYHTRVAGLIYCCCYCI